MCLFRLRLPYETNAEACELALLVLIRKNEQKMAGLIEGPLFAELKTRLLAANRVIQDPPSFTVESETKSH